VTALKNTDNVCFRK